MLYKLGVNVELKNQQKQILSHLANQIEDFYLAGGTALSLFYFDHRESEDLDFFTPQFSPPRVEQVINTFRNTSRLTVSLEGENLTEKNQIKVMVYHVHYENNSFKVDFVEDIFPLISPLKRVDGINILSLDDIYIRKISAAGGFKAAVDDIGKPQFAGGRQVAKDLFDLYFLSTKYLNLAEFLNKHGNPVMKEGMIRWFRHFDRTAMKMELADIRTTQRLEFRDIDRHFAEEIRKILLQEIS